LSGCIGNALKSAPKPDYAVFPFIWLGIIDDTGQKRAPLLKPVNLHNTEVYKKFSKEPAKIFSTVKGIQEVSEIQKYLYKKSLSHKTKVCPIKYRRLNC